MKQTQFKQLVSPSTIVANSLFSDFELLPNVKTCIVIPVKNEEDRIKKTLAAFPMQVDEYGDALDYDQFEILILANNCSDHSVRYIKDFQRNNPGLNIYVKEMLLPSHQANIGYVRRILMDEAYTRLSKNNGGVIMTTDGDTTVAPDWIISNMIEIENGADAVGGRIMFCQEEMFHMDKHTYQFHIRDETYQLLVAELESIIIEPIHDPAPRHHQHFHGSFAVTTDCYKKAGGIPNVAYLEDCAFFENLQKIDAKVRHSNKVVVHTSARYIGRAEVGLAYQLNQWNNNSDRNGNIHVESCASIVERLTFKRKLMKIWESQNLPGFHFQLEMEKAIPGIIITPDIHSTFKEGVFFGNWYSRIINLQKEGLVKSYPKVPIEKAIEDLKTVIANYSIGNFSHTSIL